MSHHDEQEHSPMKEAEPQKQGSEGLDFENLDFETALSTLEQITLQVEGGTLPLERALDEFERGVQLAAHCRAELDRAEGRIQKLVAEGKLEPFVVEEFDS
jgi:exodeoxyribonuclease VII small subunit